MDSFKPHQTINQFELVHLYSFADASVMIVSSLKINEQFIPKKG